MMLDNTTSAVLVAPTSPDRRAAAWLASRLTKGSKERFCEIVKITPAIAEQLLTLNTQNRRPLAAAIHEYSQAMSRGEWRLTAEALSVSKDHVLINGQNRLLAILDSNCTICLTVWFGCDKEEFRVADGARKRQAAQQLQIMGYAHSAVAAALAKALWVIKTRTTSFQPSTEEVLRMVETLNQTELFQACQAGQEMAKVCPPTAAAMAYWHITHTSPNAHRIEEFWQGLAVGEHLTGPRLHLRNWLMSSDAKIVSGRDSTAKKGAAIVFAWNSWLKGHKRVPTFSWKHLVQLPEAM